MRFLLAITIALALAGCNAPSGSARGGQQERRGPSSTADGNRVCTTVASFSIVVGTSGRRYNLRPNGGQMPAAWFGPGLKVQS